MPRCDPLGDDRLPEKGARDTGSIYVNPYKT